MSKIITREQAIEALWRAGELSWKLSDVQKKIKHNIENDFNKISIVVCARRLGKTWLLCTLALEQGLRHPNSIIKFIFPKQKDAKTNIRPLIRMITEDCPKDIRPEWKEQDKSFVFPNGSVIQMAGSDNQNAESIRGGFAHLCIFDETGFADDVKYIVRSILSPTIKTTGGRIIMASTPSRSANHEFVTTYMLPYMEEGRVQIYTIYDNPQFTPELIAETIAEYPDGVEDPDFQREYLCRLPDMSDKSILPSFTYKARDEIVTDQIEIPTFCHKYVSMDIGGSDLTVVLFGYYDFLEATLVILDEVVCDGGTNTAILAEMIKEKEALYWTNPIDKTVETPYKRVSDNNNAILLTDLQKLHNITFTKTKKDKREAAINALDVAILQRKIKIHPRCVTLLYHMKFAEYNNARTDFKQLKDSPTGKIRGGHADALAALVYLHRNVVKSSNPFPESYGKVTGPNIFTSLHKPESNLSSVGKVFEQIFKKKP
jgi:hypothetical protein